MIAFKKSKGVYVSPRSLVAEVDFERLICQSVRFTIQADELQNMNMTRDGAAHDGAGTEHYFEF